MWFFKIEWWISKLHRVKVGAKIAFWHDDDDDDIDDGDDDDDNDDDDDDDDTDAESDDNDNDWSIWWPTSGPNFFFFQLG